MSVAKEVLDFIEEADKRGWLDRLKQSFRKKHCVLILGSSGVGKTNFLASLKDNMAEAVEALNRTEFVQRNRISLSNEPFIFVDTPGQELHQSRRIQAIREDMGHGIDGIINVTCFGYHEGASGKKNVFEEDGSVRQDFLEQNRSNEIRLMNEWSDLLGDPKTAGWLITLVTKADLWWDHEDEVLNYYRTGNYFEALGPAQSLHPVVLPYCSVFHKFYKTGSLSGRLDDADRSHLQAALIRQLLAAVNEKHHG